MSLQIVLSPPSIAVIAYLRGRGLRGIRIDPYFLSATEKYLKSEILVILDFSRTVLELNHRYGH